jgi:hypothetical protein
LKNFSRGGAAAQREKRVWVLAGVAPLRRRERMFFGRIGGIVNWDVFRAYDIRGVYPDDINEEDYYRIALKGEFDPRFSRRRG